MALTCYLQFIQLLASFIFTHIHIPLYSPRFHSGSLAFGALIIAIIQMIRIILAYLQRKLKDKTGRITKIIFCILQCCFWLLEKFFKYVNRQAYIEVCVQAVCN